MGRPPLVKQIGKACDDLSVMRGDITVLIRVRQKVEELRVKRERNWIGTEKVESP